MGNKKQQIASDPVRVNAAQAVVLGELASAGITIDPKNPASTYRVPCYYGSCDRTFLPNGTGSLMHGGCDGARPVYAAYTAAKRAKDQARVDAIEAKLHELLAQ